MSIKIISPSFCSKGVRSYGSLPNGAIWVAVLLSVTFFGLSHGRANEVSIADSIEDPGFEAAHDANQKINVADVKVVNGWNGMPKESNAWTSVSYVDAGGKTLGDHRQAIPPAEGNSYLRMFTKKSWDWLSFTTGAFPLVNGTTYVLSFKVAADDEAPLSKLTVGIRDKVKGEYHGLTSYDLTGLDSGWHTIIYRYRYDGPDQPGALQVTGRREKSLESGSLNFDDFKTPSKDEKSSIEGVILQPAEPAK